MDRVAVLDQPIERLAIEELHDDIRQAGLIAEIVNGDDVRMAEVAGVTGFLVEAFEHLRLTGEAFGEGLDGDIAADAGVASAINDTHPALAKYADNVVLSNPRRDRPFTWTTHIPPDFSKNLRRRRGSVSVRNLSNIVEVEFIGEKLAGSQSPRGIGDRCRVEIEDIELTGSVVIGFAGATVSEGEQAVRQIRDLLPCLGLQFVYSFVFGVLNQDAVGRKRALVTHAQDILGVDVFLDRNLAWLRDQDG